MNGTKREVLTVRLNSGKGIEQCDSGMGCRIRLRFGGRGMFEVVSDAISCSIQVTVESQSLGSPKHFKTVLETLRTKGGDWWRGVEDRMVEERVRYRCNVLRSPFYEFCWSNRNG
jgi:hypothetical protein